MQINANRGPTAVGTVTISPAAASRTIGATGTLTVAAATANDADGDPFGGFTYQWIQTASATATTPCAPSCPIANVTLTPIERHAAGPRRSRRPRSSPPAHRCSSA